MASQILMAIAKRILLWSLTLSLIWLAASCGIHNSLKKTDLILVQHDLFDIELYARPFHIDTGWKSPCWRLCPFCRTGLENRIDWRYETIRRKNCFDTNKKKNTAGRGAARIAQYRDTEKLKLAAEQGNVEAQYKVGLVYLNGNGVDRDYAAAVKWFQKAAKQGDSDAQCALGECYMNGDGVTRDLSEAVKWLRLAVEQRHTKARELLNILENGDGGKADFEKGQLCYAEKNYVEAVKWYRKAAVQGYAQAQGILGFCYIKGVGVAKDPTEAVKWLRKAAVQGHSRARVFLNQIER